ncbi:PREDICTED: proline-rich protein 23D1-like [Propithecus coquereli]|uniref:proline-rich protein 23D1-like n=1 Tax=Propithecus coquereli TaxID=379532 RepID=UPI00063FCB0F|nr:PREDICTED: proline-rich protein 23D1-like [Propithecus coquereli]
MYGYRRPRSPSESWTGTEDDDAGESSLTPGQLNPPKRQHLEHLECPRTGAETPPVEGAPHLDSCQPLEPPQEQCESSTEVLMVVLEPGTGLHLSLGEEVIIVAPQTALQMTLGNVILVVVPEHVLRSVEGLQLPVETHCILPCAADVTWEFHVQSGDPLAMGAEEMVVLQVEEEAAPPNLQPLVRPPGNQVAGISPSLLMTPFYVPCFLMAAPWRFPLPPTPSPTRLPRPTDCSFNLCGLEPVPSSALRPLPPSPSPGPPMCRKVHFRPPSRARRCLFPK